MPIIRKKLAPEDVYPANIRYNEETDTVQSLVNGSWVDNPAADPRNQTTLPARITSSTECDAAQSVVDAMRSTLTETITAIDNGTTFFGLASLILALFSFGAFGVLIALAIGLAKLMLLAGKTALDAALTTTAYDTFLCILYCQFQPDGRLQPGTLETVQSDINDQIGGLGALVLNAMLGLAGEGGINNLAALGTSEGDCVDCDNCDSVCDASAQPDYFTYGNVLSVTGRKVRVQAVLYTPGSGSPFWLVQWGNYGEIGDRCCYLNSLTLISGTFTGNSERTDCAGNVHAQYPVALENTAFSLYPTDAAVFDLEFPRP